MAGVSGNVYTLAFGKQSDKGTPQTTPTYKLKVTGGDLNPVRDTIQLAETDLTRQQGKTLVVGSRCEGNPEVYVRPNDFGLLSYALLGAISTSGSSPYTHVVTPASSGPYLTVYKAIGVSALVDRYEDVRVNGMRIRGQAGGALTAQLDLMGLDVTFGETDPALAVVTQDPLTYPQVTVTKGGSAPGTIESFELNIQNNGAFQQADKQVNPYDFTWGQLDVSGTFTMLFENDDDYRSFHTGSSSGTGLATTLFTEALDIKAAATADLFVQFAIAAVAYTEVTVPPDPAGGPIKSVFGFRAMPNATIANYLTITTKNTVASY